MTEKKLAATLDFWKAYYENKGLQPEFAQQCLDYAEPLLRKDLPVIFDFDHLCLLLGMEKQYVSSIIQGTKSHYRKFAIRKRSGGIRTLMAPHFTLKYVQHWIYKNILSKISVSYCAHGFRPQKSILSNARLHFENKCLLKIDLKDFFPSITINEVIQVFRDCGYSKRVSYYLASICCVDDCLPQGAPTSPALSNIISRHMDKRLLLLCKKMGFKYTRYADDMAFSGEKISPRFVRYVERIIFECGFVLNPDKVKLYNGDGTKLLTGLSLANQQVRIPRKYRRDLEKDLYYIHQYGYQSHVRRRRIKQPNYLESLIGKVDFWLMVEPENSFAKNSRIFLEGLYKSRTGA